MEIPHGSFLRVGSQLRRESEMDPIINVFLDNGYTLQFITGILETLPQEQIIYILENLPELRKKLGTSKERIIHFLTSPKLIEDKITVSQPPFLGSPKLIKDKISVSQPPFLGFQSSQSRKQEKIN